jgi:hypothetical protein
MKLDDVAENWKLTKTKASLVVGVTPTTSEDSKGEGGNEMEVGGSPKTVSAASSFVAPNPVNDDVADDDAGNWEYIDRAENVVFQFQENEDPTSHLPYTLEVIWIHEDCEYFIFNDASAIGGGEECAEKFVPLIEREGRLT